jgi:RES domain-containing protein
MIVYRVAVEKFKDSILSGIGAEKVGGRWNEVGTRAVYCSENASLALLEYYVHSVNTNNLPSQILVAKIEFPDGLKIIEPKELPKNWMHYPYASETSSVFSKEVVQRGEFALRVPSSIVGLESNIILNPLHPEFGTVKIIEFLPLPLDERLRK